MTVEEIRGDNENRFPVGMRVLAVDDNPICLKLLETLLRKCQYHVTTTSQARIALKMLRENKDRFDLVISDVHMPDMDGFKLLELVGLEMDLPVIMLSGNGDPKLVMKGVTHGACDYLVKPVRIEELRNIWQHVIRKKKIEPKNQHKSTDQVNAHQTSGEGHVSPGTGHADQNGKYNRKRKDEEYDSEDNGNESEDPATQKKPRVVWSIELHRKFVAAVNQLGIEKAVPKRILDLMNVEGLSRENVASHLQKYRLYLKRISSVASQQANMVAALGVKDSPFMRIGSLDGMVGDFRTLAGAGRLTNPALSPYSAGGMLGRLNTPANLNLRNLTPSTLIPPTQNMNNSITDLGKIHPVLSSPPSQNPRLFQGIPSLDLDQLQPNKCTSGIANFNAIDESRMFGTANNAFTDLIGSSINLLNNGPNNNPMMIHGPNNNMASFNNKSFTLDSSKMQANPLISSEPFHSQLPVSSNNNSSGGTYLQNNLSSTAMASAILENTRGPEGLVGDVQNMRWGEQRLNNFGYGSNNAFASLNSHVPANGTVVSPLGQNLEQNNGMFNPKVDMLMNGRSGGVGSALMNDQNEKSDGELRTRSNENFLMEQSKLQGGFPPQSYDSLDELMSAMIKREQEGSMPNCDFGFDDYPFGQGL